MSIKDGLNWLKKQASQTEEEDFSYKIPDGGTHGYDADYEQDALTSMRNPANRNIPDWEKGLRPRLNEADAIAQANQKAYQDRLAQSQYEEDMRRFPMGTPPTEPTNPLDLQADPGHGSAPAPATDHMIDTNNATPVSEVDAGIGNLPSDAAEDNPMSFDAAEFGQPAPQLPTSAATMAGGAEPIQSDFLNGGNGLTSSTSGGNLMEPMQGTPAPQQPQEPPAQLPTSAATMAGGAEPIQSDFLNNEGNNSLTPNQSTNNPPAPQQPQQQEQQPQQPQQQQTGSNGIPAANATVDPAVMNQGMVSQSTGNSRAQTQAMPNGSSDYSRIFGRGFKADSGSASDKWLAGQADKLRSAGYSDNQISTMLDVNAWKKYGRNGQDYQVNTKRYTKPLGMKSASASDALWAKQAGLNDEFDDLYVRRLRVGLWDKYNG